MPNQPKKMNILKTKLLTVLFFAVGLTTYSQVGIGTTTPYASAALDITATDKGFLMPRLTTAQRMAIVGKAISLQVYDTDLDAVMLHDGSDWNAMGGDVVPFWKSDTNGGSYTTNDIVNYNGVLYKSLTWRERSFSLIK